MLDKRPPKQRFAECAAIVWQSAQPARGVPTKNSIGAINLGSCEDRYRIDALRRGTGAVEELREHCAALTRECAAKNHGRECSTLLWTLIGECLTATRGPSRRRSVRCYGKPLAHARALPEEQVPLPHAPRERRRALEFRPRLCRSAGSLLHCFILEPRNDATTGYRFVVTRWRSEVNSNCRYRFLNCQTTTSCYNLRR